MHFVNLAKSFLLSVDEVVQARAGVIERFEDTVIGPRYGEILQTIRLDPLESRTADGARPTRAVASGKGVQRDREMCVFVLDARHCLDGWRKPGRRLF